MKQDELDQFFTKPAVARRCLAWLQERIPYKGSDALWLEPSVGQGAFFKTLPSHSRAGFDIDSKLAAACGAEQCDFLSLTALTNPLPGDKPLVVVGNPPFGYRSKVAIDFISKSFELGAEYVAFILPLGLKPYANGRPPVAEKSIQGGHSVDYLELADHDYILPDGGTKRIENCFFILYKRGFREPVDVSPTCDTYATIHTIRTYKSKTGKCSPTGLQHAKTCDFYLPNAVHEGKQEELYPRKEFDMGAMFGVKIHREYEAIMDWAFKFDWKAVARRSTNCNLSLGVETIQQALIAAGFRDRSDYWASAYSIGTAHKKAGTTKWGHEHIPHCDLFLPASRYHGQPMLASPTKDFESVVGIQVHHNHREAVLQYLRDFDWAKVARRSTNRNLSLTLPIVEDVITKFTPPPELALHYIVLKGKFARAEDQIENCELFLPACQFASGIKATKSFQGTRSVGIQFLDTPRRDKILTWIMNHDWDNAARTGLSTHRHLGKQIIEQELRFAGFRV